MLDDFAAILKPDTSWSGAEKNAGNVAGNLNFSHATAKPRCRIAREVA